MVSVIFLLIVNMLSMQLFFLASAISAVSLAGNKVSAIFKVTFEKQLLFNFVKHSATLF